MSKRGMFKIVKQKSRAEALLNTGLQTYIFRFDIPKMIERIRKGVTVVTEETIETVMT